MMFTRRQFMKYSAAGAALLGRREAFASADVPDRPNIVLCMADDQGWGDMGYYGHPVLRTPNFDRLAAEGLRFDRFYAAAPVCSPTRASVLTGRTPNRMGCFKWGYPLRPQEITLPEALKSAGYVSGHFGKWHLGSCRKGSPVNPGASGFDEWLSAENFFDNDPILSREGVAVQCKGESSAVTVAAALQFIRRYAAAKRPFLAVVWFGSPHNPHRAAERDRALYRNHPKNKQNFYGEITGMDRAFGRLRRELHALGVRENTLLWYCSDNGGLPGLSVTGGRGHKGQVYEGGLRVPALLEWPAVVRQPRITGVPCVTSDIYPTILDIAGIHPADQPPLDGISLLPLLEGRMTQRPRPLGFWDYPIRGIRTPSHQWMLELLKAQRQGREPDNKERLRLDAGVITGRYPEDSFPGHAAWLDWPWKLHRKQGKGGQVTWELYNLTDDPDEKTNVVEKQTARAARMRAGLEQWLVSVVRSLNGKDYP